MTSMEQEPHSVTCETVVYKVSSPEEGEGASAVRRKPAPVRTVEREPVSPGPLTIEDVRRKGRERKARWLEKLKADPERYALHLEKERERKRG